MYNRSPAVLAMTAGTLAQLSGDRFVLGLGSSSHAIIRDWNGIDFDAPLGHVRESVAIIRQALEGKKTDFQGEHFRSHGLRIGSLPASPVRIYLAGAASAGRDASGDEVVCRFQVAITDDVPAARGLVRMAFGGYLAAPVYNRFLAWCGFESEAAAIAQAFARRDRQATGAAMHDDFIDRITILGTADQCREQIAAFVYETLAPANA